MKKHRERLNVKIKPELLRGKYSPHLLFQDKAICNRISKCKAGKSAAKRLKSLAGLKPKEKAAIERRLLLKQFKVIRKAFGLKKSDIEK